MISCKFLVMEGMNVTRLSPELRQCLKGVLRTAALHKTAKSKAESSSSNGTKTRAKSALASTRKK